MRHRNQPAQRSAQSGVVMIVALMLLAALTLAGVALMRSVSTTNVVAGNLAFRQSATRSADLGIESGVQWIDAQAPTDLYANSAVNGYWASSIDPVPGQSWIDFFETSLVPLAAALPINDGAGNTILYVVQRLCTGVGDPALVRCTNPPGSRSACNSSGSSCSSGGDSMLGTNDQGQLAGPSSIQPKVYYRITARVSGPRNTRSYVQSIVSF